MVGGLVVAGWLVAAGGLVVGGLVVAGGLVAGGLVAGGLVAVYKLYVNTPTLDIVMHDRHIKDATIREMMTTLFVLVESIYLCIPKLTIHQCHMGNDICAPYLRQICKPV